MEYKTRNPVTFHGIKQNNLQLKQCFIRFNLVNSVVLLQTLQNMVMNLILWDNIKIQETWKEQKGSGPWI